MGTAPRSPQSLLDGLGPAGKYTSFRKRQVIYSAGEQSESIFLIGTGTIKLTVVSAEGNEAVTAVLDAGELFGAEAMGVPAARRAANAVALTNVQLAKLGPDTVMEVLRSHPAICALFISCLTSRIARLQDELASCLLYNSEQRLARALLFMAELGRTHKPQSIPEMSQQDLASMIGTTRQRVNSLMKRFRDMGLIEDAHGRSIHSSLQKVAGPDLKMGMKR